MNLAPYVNDLRQHLAVAAETGTAETVAVAERLAAALEAATRLVLLDALSAAAGEITREMAPGAVDVRLRGGEVAFVVTPALSAGFADVPPEQGAAPVPRPSPAADADETGTTRTTLRLPDQLKARVEEVAAREGVSVNTWLIRAVTAALEPRPAATSKRDPGGGERFTGWVR